ncbi:MAG: 4Fe-4S binding protein, partial [Limisphaerales bacterium]
VCMSCQICVEVCPFDAIKMDQVYELSRFDRFEGLLLHKKDLAKSNDYYHSIHPTEASEVDQNLAAEKAKAEAAKAKAAAPPAPAKFADSAAVTAKSTAAPASASSTSSPPQPAPAKAGPVVPPPAPTPPTPSIPNPQPKAIN